MAAQTSGPEQPDRQPSQRPQVLVIEDEALIAMLIEHILSDSGYDVITVFSGEEALARAVSIDRLSLVVTDIGLAFGIDGRSVLRELRVARPHLPAVVVTGFGQLRHEADLRGLGGPTARLLKPFYAEELAACVADVLSGRNRRADGRGGLSRAGDPDDTSR